MTYSVKEYMRKDFFTIDVEATVLEASKLMLDKNVGYIIVLEKGRPIGMISERDIIFKVVALEKDPSKVKVDEVMSKPLISVDPDATLSEVVELMVKYDLRRIPVIKDGIIYGIFSTRELAKHFREYEDRIVRDILRVMSRFSIPF